MIPVLLFGVLVAGCSTSTAETSADPTQSSEAQAATDQAETTFAVPDLVGKTVAQATEIVADLGGTLGADLDDPGNVVKSQEVRLASMSPWAPPLRSRQSRFTWRFR